MQSHMMPSCEASSDCLRNQIHPCGVALATLTRLSINGDQSATTYLKLARHDACLLMITPATYRNALWIAATGTG
jgi:hypothetical protein